MRGAHVRLARASQLLATAAGLALAAGCAGEPPFCEGEVRFAYDPLRGEDLVAFPDDFFTADDPDSLTGLRVQTTDAPWVGMIPAGYEATFAALDELDGWGTTAGVTLRFTGELGPAPTGMPDSLESDAVQLLELTDGGVRRVPFELKRTDEETTLILWPMQPLRPATRHAVVVTDGLRAADGSCISPGAATRELLAGRTSSAALTRISQRYREVLERTGLAPERISAATVFTTQSIVEQSEAIAQDIAQRTYAWSQPPTCEEPSAMHRLCEGRFVAKDYRDPDGVVRGITPAGEYELTVRFWLPLAQEDRPWPLVIFGHGLVGWRDQAKALADQAAPIGVVAAALDAVGHGDHPTAPEGAKSGGIANASVAAGFFGIDLSSGGELRPLVLRDNWRQSTYDKLQFLRLLTEHRDVDDDGTDDLDTDHIAYLGASLGGIMGAELLAMTDRIGAGILSVPGGRVSSIISDAALFSFIIDIMRPKETTDGDIDRFFPVLQTIIEKGDSANYAPYVLRNRRPNASGRVPHLLFNMAIDDDTVPEVTNFALARALGIPQLAPAIREVGVVPLESAPYPVEANLEDGKTTAGLFQYDRVRRRGRTEVEVATHDNTTASTEGIHQAIHFLRTWLETGTASIIDPYEVLETPPLP